MPEQISERSSELALPVTQVPKMKDYNVETYQQMLANLEEMRQKLSKQERAEAEEQHLKRFKSLRLNENDEEVAKDYHEEFVKKNGESDCAVCLDPLSEGETVDLVCGHNYHSKCMLMWQEKNRSCPLCREEIKIIF